MRQDNSLGLKIQNSFEELDIDRDGYIDREDVSF